MQYCSLQHQTLLPSPITCTIRFFLLLLLLFCCGSVSSFFLELFLNSSLVAYLASTDLGRSSVSVISFCFFILFTGYSRQEHCSILPFPSPEDCILSEPSTVTCPSGVSLYSKTHSFIELDKVVVHLYTCVQEYPCVLFIPELKKRALGVFSKRCILSLPFPYMQSDLRNPHQKNKNKNKNKLVFKFFWIGYGALQWTFSLQQFIRIIMQVFNLFMVLVPIAPY